MSRKPKEKGIMGGQGVPVNSFKGARLLRQILIVPNPKLPSASHLFFSSLPDRVFLPHRGHIHEFMTQLQGWVACYGLNVFISSKFIG